VKKILVLLWLRVAPQGADVVFFGEMHPEAGPLVRQLREQGLPDVAFLTGDGVVTDELISTTGGAACTNGVYMTFGPDPRLLPDAKAGVEKFRNAGTEPEGYTLYAYASLQALAAAFNGAKSIRERTLLNGLRAIPLILCLVRKKWDYKGD
jgi:branched-chain amino acid transport system substrate-binding protein